MHFLQKLFWSSILFSLPFLISCNPFLNFGVVAPHALYRSGQPDKDDLKAILKKAKIKTILNLKLGVNEKERSIARRFGAEVIHMPLSARTPPTEEELLSYLALLQNPKTYPLWVHCQGGADRTGVMIAIYRLEFDHWSKWEAILEMLRYFHIPFVYPKLTTYIYHYHRRLGHYQETDSEMKLLKENLQERGMLDEDPSS